MVAPVTSSVGDNQENQEPHEDEAGAAQLAMALTPKQRVALDALLVPGATAPDAAEKAGVHRGTVNRWLHCDENFIAAFNARLLKHITLTNAHMLALVPKALKAIEYKLNAGDARIGIQVIKSVTELSKLAPVISSAAIAQERKVAEQQEQLELQTKQVAIDEQQEKTVVRKKEVEAVRLKRTDAEKPYEQRYEKEQRRPSENRKQAALEHAIRQKVDARIAAEVNKAAASLMNPGTQQKQSTASPDATGKTHPGTPTTSKSTESPGR